MKCHQIKKNEIVSDMNAYRESKKKQKFEKFNWHNAPTIGKLPFDEI
jgi:hypothetical protein